MRALFLALFILGFPQELVANCQDMKDPDSRILCDRLKETERQVAEQMMNQRCRDWAEGARDLPPAYVDHCGKLGFQRTCWFCGDGIRK